MAQMTGRVTLKTISDDMFAAHSEALVIPTNAYGINGAGLALAATMMWPLTMCRYGQDASRKYGEFPYVPGGVWSWPGDADVRLILAATKDHYSKPSQMPWIEKCCAGIEAEVAKHSIRSIGIPALGVGCGRLPWAEVRRVILDSAERMAAAGVVVRIYPPRPTNRKVRRS
jgi:O-acetyl-ADP-ribose deacetylase (regulator of RNase III)